MKKYPEFQDTGQRNRPPPLLNVTPVSEVDGGFHTSLQVTQPLVASQHVVPQQGLPNTWNVDAFWPTGESPVTRLAQGSMWPQLLLERP